jgi:stage III sporulation protein AE
MRKTIILILIFFFLFIPKAWADDGGSSVDLSKMEDFSKRLQQDYDYMPQVDVSKMVDTYRSTGSVGLAFKDMMQSVKNFIFKEVRGNARLMVELLFLGLLCAVLKNIQNAFSNDSVSKIGYYACFLVMIIIIVRSISLSMQVGRETIDNMIQFTNSMMPAMLVLLAAVGGFASAATLDPIIMFTVKVISDVIRDLILPMTIFVVVLNIVDNLSENIKITEFAKLLQQMNKWALGLIMTVFIGVITVRSSMSSTLDQLTAKTAKFAVDYFIPVVGKALSDAVSTVAGYSLVLKDAVSLVGLVIMIFICLFPLIKIILIALVYKFVGAVMQPVVDGKVVNCLSAVGNSLTMIFACVLSVAVMFFIMITIIASTGKLVMAG